MAAQSEIGDLAFDLLAAFALDVIAGDREPAYVDALWLQREAPLGAKSGEVDAGIAILDAGRVKSSIQREAGFGRPGAGAVDHGGTLPQLAQAQDSGDVGQGCMRGVFEGGARLVQVLDTAGGFDIGLAGHEPGGIERDAVALHGERELHIERLGAVLRILQMQRGGGEGPAIAWNGRVVADVHDDVFAAHVERRGAVRFDFGEAALHGEVPDRGIQEALDGGLVALGFRFRDVGAAIGSDDQIDVRLGDVERLNVDVAFGERYDLQADDHRGSAEQRRLVRRLGAMDDEVVHFGAKLLPMEAEGADLDAPAGGGFDGGNQLQANFVIEPVALEHDHGGDARQDQERNQPTCEPRYP